MESSDIITLSFYNYTPEPVVQKWSSSTLRMLPFFDSMFSGPWKDSSSRSYVMDCDPNDFIKVIDKIRYGNKDRISVLSSSLGLINPSQSKIAIKREFYKGADDHVYNLDALPVTQVFSMKWLASSKLTSLSQFFKIVYDQKEYSFDQTEKVFEKMNEKLLCLGKIGYFAVRSKLTTLPASNCGTENALELTLILEYE